MAIKSAAGRSRRTKAEVQDEFEKIKEQTEQERLEFNPKTAEQARQREEEVKQALKEITSEGLVQRIASLGIEVSRTFSDLSSKLTAENDLLTSLREAVALEKKEMENLHKIDVCATGLDQLIQEHEQKKMALEAEISSTRAAWSEEQDKRLLEQKEFDDNLKKQRQRERDEYEYQKNSERKKDQDACEEAERLQERKNKEKQEALEKNWQAREVALKEREDELNRLRKEATDFPERMKKESEKNAAEALRALELRHQHDILAL